MDRNNEDLSFNQWEERGVRLLTGHSRLQWEIGDWWRSGECYGGRRNSIPEHYGLDYRTCENYASVARAFDSSRRREKLSFAHHADVASWLPKDADKLLDWCLEGAEANGRTRSRQELRDEMRRRAASDTQNAKTITVEVEQIPKPHPEPTYLRLAQVRPEPEPIMALDTSSAGTSNWSKLRDLREEPPPPLDRVAMARAAFEHLSFDEQLRLIIDFRGHWTPEQRATIRSALCE